jgi:hypothetical protein
MTTNGRVGEKNGTKPEDPLGDFMNLGNDFLHGIEQAIDKGMALREAQAKYGTPGTARITVRHDQGLLHRENPEDRKRAEAEKLNRDRQILSAEHVSDLGKYIASGQKFVLDIGVHLREITADLPDDMQPLGTMLTKAGLQILSQSFLGSAKFNAERGFQTIDQATPPGQQ